MRRTIAAAGVVAMAVATAAACGDDTPAASQPTSPSSASTPVSSGTATAAANPSAASVPVPAGSAAPVTGVYAPSIDPAAFTATVDNPFFPLRQGMRWEYRSQTEDGVETTVVTVTDKTKTIMGVTCVEVRDTVTLDGELKEDTFDWYAQHRDGTVWYFGEDTKEYEDGKVATTKGSWVAGVDGALPGIVMAAQPRVGDRYRQEYYRGEAEDMADVLGTAEQATVPAGSYDGVLKTKDYTPLEPDLLEHKYYARGVGTVLTVDVAGDGRRDELVTFTAR